jgi:hypothetical protein
VLRFTGNEGQTVAIQRSGNLSDWETITSPVLAYPENLLPLGVSLRTSFYRLPSMKVAIGSIPIHRTMSEQPGHSAAPQCEPCCMTNRS